jgi:hypothetical protein
MSDTAYEAAKNDPGSPDAKIVREAAAAAVGDNSHL